MSVLSGVSEMPTWAVANHVRSTLLPAVPVAIIPPYQPPKPPSGGADSPIALSPDSHPVTPLEAFDCSQAVHVPDNPLILSEALEKETAAQETTNPTPPISPPSVINPQSASALDVAVRAVRSLPSSPLGTLSTQSIFQPSESRPLHNQSCDARNDTARPTSLPAPTAPTFARQLLDTVLMGRLDASGAALLNQTRKQTCEGRTEDTPPPPHETSNCPPSKLVGSTHDGAEPGVPSLPSARPSTNLEDYGQPQTLYPQPRHSPQAGPAQVPLVPTFQPFINGTPTVHTQRAVAHLGSATPDFIDATIISLQRAVSKLEANYRMQLQMRSQGRPHGDVDKLSREVQNVRLWLDGTKIPWRARRPSALKQQPIALPPPPPPPPLSASTAYNLASQEEAWCIALDQIGAKMQGAWDITLQAREAFTRNVRAHQTDLERAIHETRTRCDRLRQERDAAVMTAQSHVESLKGTNLQINHLRHELEVARRPTELSDSTKSQHDAQAEHMIAMKIFREKQAAMNPETSRLQILLDKRTKRMTEIEQEKHEEIDKIKAESINLRESFEQRMASRQKVEMKQYDAKHREIAILRQDLGTSKAEAALIEASRVEFANDLVKLKRELVASKQGSALAVTSAVKDCELRLESHLADLATLRIDLRDERSLSERFARELDKANLALSSERTARSQLEQKVASLQDQLEEAQTARTMSPGAEVEHDQLVEKLRVSTERLGVLGEELERSLYDRFERQGKQTELEERIRALQSRHRQLEAKIPSPSPDVDLVSRKRRTPLFLGSEEEDSPIRPMGKRQRVIESSLLTTQGTSLVSTPPSQNASARIDTVPAEWVRTHLSRCVLPTSNGQSICKICFVEHKKTQKAKGVPESSLGDVKDQPPLPGKPSAQQVVQHVLGHQGVLRRLMDKVIREEKERAVKEGSSHRWIESSNPALSI